jgi:hypothetical protein
MRNPITEAIPISLGAAILLLTTVLSLQSGCSQTTSPEQRLEKAYAFAVKNTEEDMQNLGGQPAYLTEAYEKALSILKNRQVTDCPNLLLVLLWSDERPGRWMLSLWWLELDNDDYAVKVLERDARTGQESTEQYALTTIARDRQIVGRFSLSRQIQKLPVRIRKNTQREVKDEAAWKAWEKNPTLDAYPPAPIWVSLPDDSREVWVSIINVAGRESKPMALRVVKEGEGARLAQR